MNHPDTRSSVDRTCLITGGAGNLACQLSWQLEAQFDRIVLFDIAAQPLAATSAKAVFETGDLLAPGRVDELLVRHRPGTIIHLASVLSGGCEQNRELGWRVNMDGSFLLFEAALRHGVSQVLFASTVAAFGGALPAVLTETTPQWPDGLYGVTKMAIERLGVYYHRKHGLDFRCLRLPITISRHAPVGAASAFASHAFIGSVHQGAFTFRVRPETPLALIYVRDVLRGVVGLLSAPAAHLNQRVYNLAAMTVTSAQIATAIQRRLPAAQLTFAPDPAISSLLASWPGRMDDDAARRDWSWKEEYDLDRTADDFIGELQAESARLRASGERGIKS